MTTQTDYADLIRRLEAATGPDRQLDRDIGIAVLGWKLIPPSGVFDDMLLIDGSFYPNHPGAEYPELTESLDAALTLVPEGKYWEVAFGRPTKEVRHRYWAEIYGEEDAHESLHPICAGATPAIAFCIAAIKARAAIAKGAA